ncbi:TetR/AcrR family transcriptional regulator [Jatrophihabitans telluris]|uniref:TetR/AcrR family transcriptional regulator n=1 Tax=Jatrophihabitans telluris TaxID=2038343 RepID=A0ABY4QZ50_9ACTN|nr:TetR/AcrR family transcriptional regulator [Jatrophihabitans telluris]UQX88765.1 TetR/AcrR family transcriptional regulator [Jatrophihabitans telluris]
MASDSRARMVRSAASLIASRGVNATSFSDVLADSGAPRGSIYHHFPEGKDQLAAEAVRWTGEQVLAFQRAGEFGGAVDVLDRFVGMWRRVVLSSDGRSGCVVAGVAVDTGTVGAAAIRGGEYPAPDADDGLITVVRQTFRAWVSLLAAQFAGVGMPPGRADALAVTTVAALEGALILCRAEGGVGPLDAVAAELARLLPDAAVGPDG